MAKQTLPKCTDLDAAISAFFVFGGRINIFSKDLQHPLYIEAYSAGVILHGSPSPDKAYLTPVERFVQVRLETPLFESMCVCGVGPTHAMTVGPSATAVWKICG